MHDWLQDYLPRSIFIFPDLAETNGMCFEIYPSDAHVLIIVILGTVYKCILGTVSA